MKKENHFVLLKFENLYSFPSLDVMDDEYVLVLIEDLTGDEAEAVAGAVQREASNLPGYPQVWVESDSESREDKGRYLFRCRKAAEIRETLRTLRKEEEATTDDFGRLALFALRCVEDVRTFRATDGKTDEQKKPRGLVPENPKVPALQDANDRRLVENRSRDELLELLEKFYRRLELAEGELTGRYGPLTALDRAPIRPREVADLQKLAQSRGIDSAPMDRYWRTKHTLTIIGAARRFLDQLSDAITAPPDESPPEDLLAELSRQQRKILLFLWKRRSASLGELYEDVWGQPVNPETVTKAIKRLNERLLELRANQTVTLNHGYVILDRMN